MITLKVWQFVAMNFVTVGVGTFIGALIAGGVLIRKLDIARMNEAIEYNEELIDYLDKEREDLQDEIDDLEDDDEEGEE